MVDKIYEIKNRILEQLAQDVQAKGVERLDDKMVDMVKDLAEAEKNCWKAEYYRAVTEAMDGKSGYQGMHGYQAMQDRQGQRRGYGNMNRMGHTDMVESVRMAMQGMDPAERDRMREQLRAAMEM